MSQPRGSGSSPCQRRSDYVNYDSAAARLYYSRPIDLRNCFCNIGRSCFGHNVKYKITVDFEYYFNYGKL